MAAPEFTLAERSNLLTFLGFPLLNYSKTVILESYLGIQYTSRVCAGGMNISL